MKKKIVFISKFFIKSFSAIFILVNCFANFGLSQNRTNQIQVLLKQGEVYLEEYEFEKALAASAEALKIIQSGKRQSSIKLAMVYFLEGKIYEKGLYFDKAVAAFTTALKYNPRNAEIYQNRAAVYEYIGETEKAEADYEKAENLIKAGKETYPREINSNLMVIGTGFSSAIEYREEFQTIKFNEIPGYSEAVEIIDTNKDGNISQEEFRQSHISHLLKLNKIVRFNPKSDLALWIRGDFYLRLDEMSNQFFWISTESDFIDAFEINPRYEYLVNRGVVRARRNNKTNFEFAVKFFSDAIKINDKSTEAFYNRGLSYAKLYENEKAIADFTEVIKLDSGFVVAYKSRAKAFRALGKTTEAEADEAMLKRLGGK